MRDSAPTASESARAENRREDQDQGLESSEDSSIDASTAAVTGPGGPADESASQRSLDGSDRGSSDGSFGDSSDAGDTVGASEQSQRADMSSGDADGAGSGFARIGPLSEGAAGLASVGLAAEGTDGTADAAVKAGLATDAAPMAVGGSGALSPGATTEIDAEPRPAEVGAARAESGDVRAIRAGVGPNDPNRAAGRALGNDAAPRAQDATASNASTGSASTSASSAATGAASDPLARLIEQARPAIERAQTAPAADAVAGRLAEVEGAIARSRVQQSVEQGRLTITSSNDTSPATTTITATAVQSAGGRDGAAASGGFGGGDAGTAFAGPAADLASALADGEAHPAAQLAAKGVGLLANQRGGAITMRLEPPALGALRIELMVRQGAVVADFTAATPEARVLLEANLGMLRERLESQGLSVERISVHGGRGTESAASATAQGGGDARQEGAGARSDGGERGERSGTRQDAAGGESRGRRDGEPRGGRERTDAQRQEGPRGFAATLTGETAQRTEPKRRAG